MPISKHRKNRKKPGISGQPIRSGSSESRSRFRGAYRETYLQDWLDSGRALITGDQDVRHVVESRLGRPEYSMERLVRELDRRMLHYADAYPKDSRAYEASGLYRQIVDFIEPKGGLLVDIACADGYLLAAWPGDTAIGNDINGYQLQRGEEVLRRAGKVVNRYSRSVVGFDQRRGFILESDPEEQDVDLEGITLIFDDIMNLNRTAEVLERNNTKADIVTMVLGGSRTTEPFNFLDSETQRFNIHFLPYVMDNLHKICEPGARCYFAIGSGGIKNDVEFRRGMGMTLPQFWQKNYGNTIDVGRHVYLSLPESHERVGGDALSVVETIFKGT